MNEKLETEESPYKKLAEYESIAILLLKIDNMRSEQIYEFLDYLICNEGTPELIEFLTKRFGLFDVLEYFKSDSKKVRDLLRVLLEYNYDRTNFAQIIEYLCELGLTDLVAEFKGLSGIEGIRKYLKRLAKEATELG
jgi:hypothetical protein